MTEIICNGRNLYIEKKRPQMFQKVGIIDGKIFIDEREVLSGEGIYACLYYDKFKNVTFIVRREEVYLSSFIFEDKKKFKEFLDEVCKQMPDVRVSEQNKKITGYASALVVKLREGIETEIFDNKEEEEVPCCPVCGMQCAPNIPYCMECGAAV